MLLCKTVPCLVLFLCNSGCLQTPVFVLRPLVTAERPEANICLSTH